ncbi:putative permease [Gottschalkia purinilytica]|uniref:Putative permease n=1 Tax=Gottschalkia purinilytica TaxID=1503 RepID=A0A0L0W7X9_GOTPU|nr:permease [Gottschalkia purinilytica]KNF07537.1 putative permease [Gottschalkia purinilytica]
MNIIRKYKWLIVFIVLIIVIYNINSTVGVNTIYFSFSNIKTFLSLVPPIFILMGLLDVWVPKETMVKYMGKDSGIKGLLCILTLGSLAAGPLYVSFPIAHMFIKKGVKLSYIIFFIGVWANCKVPMMVYEYTSLGGTFTFLHITTSLFVYLVLSILVEKYLSEDEIKNIYNKESTTN